MLPLGPKASFNRPWRRMLREHSNAQSALEAFRAHGTSVLAQVQHPEQGELLYLIEHSHDIAFCEKVLIGQLGMSVTWYTHPAPPMQVIDPTLLAAMALDILLSEMPDLFRQGDSRVIIIEAGAVVSSHTGTEGDAGVDDPITRVGEVVLQPQRPRWFPKFMWDRLSREMQRKLLS